MVIFVYWYFIPSYHMHPRVTMVPKEKMVSLEVPAFRVTLDPQGPLVHPETLDLR